jgi:hypothetical protein
MGLPKGSLRIQWLLPGKIVVPFPSLNWLLYPFPEQAAVPAQSIKFQKEESNQRERAYETSHTQ